MAATGSSCGGTCASSCVSSTELTSAGAICGISELSNGVSVVGGATIDGSLEGTMLLMSETDDSAGKGTSDDIDDSKGRLCCAIMLGISTASTAFADGWLTSAGVGWGGWGGCFI